MNMVTIILGGVLAVWLISHGSPARAEASARLSGSEVIHVAYPRPFTVTPQDGIGAATEPRSGRRFAVAVSVEAERAGERITRFTIHAPDVAMRPLAVRVARFMGLLWAYADSRFRVLNSRLRSGQARVWLCRDGEGGAEQSRDSIYLYDVMVDRSDLEWARTLAHEYGHYLLPGPAGYAHPEPWSNGLLGERLFLGWLAEEMRAGKLGQSDAVFLSKEAAEEYCAKQVTPLIERTARRGVDPGLIADKGKAGMDEAIGLLLYASRLHGANALADMLEWLPTRTGRQADGPDYLRGYEAWLRGSDLIRHRPDALMMSEDRAAAGTRTVTYMAYMPAGRWHVVSPHVGSLKVDGCASSRDGEGYRIQAAAAGWRAVRVELQTTDADCELRWVRMTP